MSTVLLPVREDLFWAKVAITPGCWLWTGALTEGYGAFGVRRRMRLAHRVSYTLVHGEIPAGLHLDHLCHNLDKDACTVQAECLHRRCVNPDHLEAVPPRLNVQRGRAAQVASERRRAITHCVRGHDLNGPDVWITEAGARVCRRCEWERKGIDPDARPRRYSETEIHHVYELLDQGLSQTAVAAVTGISRPWICQLAKRRQAA